jgi:hypothetical protein
VSLTARCHPERSLIACILPSLAPPRDSVQPLPARHVFRKFTCPRTLEDKASAGPSGEEHAVPDEIWTTRDRGVRSECQHAGANGLPGASPSVLAAARGLGVRVRGRFKPSGGEPRHEGQQGQGDEAPHDVRAIHLVPASHGALPRSPARRSLPDPEQPLCRVARSVRSLRK